MTRKSKMTKPSDIDAFLDGLKASGDLREVGLSEDAKFEVVEMGDLIEMLKARILSGLPPHVRADIQGRADRNHR